MSAKPYYTLNHSGLRPAKIILNLWEDHIFGNKGYYGRQSSFMLDNFAHYAYAKNIVNNKGVGMKLNAIDILAVILVIVGGINWGLVGWLDYNLVAEIFGAGSGISRVVYALVGVAALYMVYVLSKIMGRSKAA